MIDEGQEYEAAAEWFPPFLAAAMMTPSHPLRESVMNAATETVRDAYRDERYLPFMDVQQPLEDIADQVAMALRGSVIGHKNRHWRRAWLGGRTPRIRLGRALRSRGGADA